MYYNEKDNEVVINRGDNYSYIGSYKSNEVTIDGKYSKRKYIRVKCPYCGTEYDVDFNSSFKRSAKCNFCCNKYENSFAYYIQQILKEPLSKYWDWEKNKVNPYLIYKNCIYKVWIKCINKTYHESYYVLCNKFVAGRRCPYCSGKSGKVHELDSFKYLYPSRAKCWDFKKNSKMPSEVYPHTAKKYWFICERCGKSFKRSLEVLNFDIKFQKDTGVCCRECNSSSGEFKIIKYLNNNNIKYEFQKTYENLIGTRGGLLSYDFYLPNYNLLIEYQGEFHDGNNNIQTENELQRQKEHDRRKREYAKARAIKFLEIWYYDFDNIEEILNNELEIKLMK